MWHNPEIRHSPSFAARLKHHVPHSLHGYLTPKLL